MRTPFSLFLLVFICSFPITLLFGQRTITGVIYDETGHELFGAVIRVAGTTIGIVSDLDGQFELNVPVDPSVNLLVTHIGYEPQQIPLAEKSRFEIHMAPSFSTLDQVIVTGYGTQSRRRLTSAIVSTGEEAFEGVPATSIQDGLQGRLPGVVFTRGSGALGSGVSIRVRGVASINANNQPLIVIDGLIFEGQSGFGLGSGGTNPLLNHNPGDIESIEVLKDGAASAIYGSRGSNGVIIVTTKRGKFNAQARVNLSYNIGFSEPTARYDLLNGAEFASLWNEAARNVGLGANPAFILDENNQPSTDWIDLSTRQAFQQEFNAGVSGGSNTTQYYIGGNYRDEDGFYLDTNLKRYSFRANIDQMINDQVRAGLSLNPSLTVVDRVYEGAALQAPNLFSSLVPPIVEPYDEDGELITPLRIPPLNFPQTNPLVNVLESDVSLTTAQALVSTYLEYRPWHFLKLRAEFGAEYTQVENLIKNSSRTSFGNDVNGSGTADTRRVVDYNATAMATYDNTFSGIHALDITLGANLTRRSIHFQSVSGNNFADDRLLVLDAATNITQGFSSKTDAAFTGLFARANYAFSNRYLVTLSARYDGSSRFGKDNRYGFFPAVSAGWILTEEPFFNSNLINYLKIRGSIGESGNGDLFDFASLGLVSIFSYAGEPSFVLDQLENRDLRWETTIQYNGAVDFGLWNNRISGSLGYFVKNTNDLLLDVPLPGTTGIFFSFQNVGKVRNQGFEFDLSADLVTGNFSWNLALNGATLQNEILALPDNDNDGVDDDIIAENWIFRTGESMASWYLVPYAGVDPTNGDALYRTREGETVPINPPSSERVVMGNSIPSFTGGFTNTFQWKGLDLSAFFQFATGHYLYRFEGEFLEESMARGFNQLRSQLDAWTPDNPDTDVPQARLNSSNGNRPNTSRYLDKADYLRLKNLQLGYTFTNLGRRNGRLRLYASALNLLTFTGYDGLDPEVSNTGPRDPGSGRSFFSSPQNRIFSFGFNYEL